MDLKTIVKSLFADFKTADEQKINSYFDYDAKVILHNLNKTVTAEEYIKMNMQEGNNWNGKVQRITAIDDLKVCIVKAEVIKHDTSLLALAFIKFSADKIICFDEYLGHDGNVLDEKIAEYLISNGIFGADRFQKDVDNKINEYAK